MADARSVARAAFRRTVNSALMIQAARSGKGDDLSLIALVDELSQECTLVSKGDLRRPEAMLTAHSHTADSLFSRLTRMAFQNLDNFDVAERLLRLAFKAQSYTRATIETIGVLKNPPMVLAKQANVTTGPQQVNNYFHAHAGEPESEPNKPLEQAHAEPFDAAIGSDSNCSDIGTEREVWANRMK